MESCRARTHPCWTRARWGQGELSKSPGSSPMSPMCAFLVVTLLGCDGCDGLVFSRSSWKDRWGSRMVQQPVKLTYLLQNYPSTSLPYASTDLHPLTPKYVWVILLPARMCVVSYCQHACPVLCAPVTKQWWPLGAITAKGDYTCYGRKGGGRRR